jgi:hypothetical protein
MVHRILFCRGLGYCCKIGGPTLRDMGGLASPNEET